MSAITDVESRESQYDSVSERVIEAVAAAKGVDPLDLGLCLYDVIDPDALDKLFQPTPTGVPRQSGQVSFTLDGCEVTVHSSGEVTVMHEAADDSEQE